MGRTRDVLKELGKSKISEQTLVEAGQQVLRDGIKKYLQTQGITEAVGFEVTLKNGETFTILSDENPRAGTPMTEVASIQPRQSAKAGSVDDVWANLLSITIMF